MSKLRSDTLTLEHIDPRNGFLVCGLCVEENEILADASYNYRKVNRFVPYRICNYRAPVHPGDLCEFLINGQWTICEFAVPGGIWWEESHKIGCSTTNRRGEKNSEEGNIKRSNSVSKLKWWNDGEKNIRSPNYPGEGWVKGRLPFMTDSDKKRISDYATGTSFWNDGQICVRSAESPGPEWGKGRLPYKRVKLKK